MAGKLAKGVKQILSGDQARLKINLRELFGTSVPNSSEFRQAVGQAIIDQIRERSANKRGWEKGFAGYSDSYAKSIEFRAYGKSKNNPNLKQTGDMLGLMDVIDETPYTITIGWTDEKEAAKAHGHVTGNIGVQRDFLGINIGEAERLSREFADDLANREADSVRPGFVPSVPAAGAFVARGNVPQRQTVGFGEALKRFLDGED